VFLSLLLCAIEIVMIVHPSFAAFIFDRPR